MPASFSGRRCSIYAHRPWICRTYPFMLVDDDLLSRNARVSGRPSPRAAHDVALGLCRRQAAEAAEEDGVRAVYRRARVPPGGRVVIDSEGVKVLHD